MRVEDIIPDFSNMTDAEIEESIRTVRRSRTTAKQVTVSKRPTIQKEKNIDAAASALKKALTSEQLDLLKQHFLGGNK